MKRETGFLAGGSSQRVMPGQDSVEEGANGTLASRYLMEESGRAVAGPLSFWSANAAAWSFIALFAVISRIVAFDDVALAVTLTLVLDPVGFLLTSMAYKFYLERAQARGTVIAAWALVGSVAGGLLQMTICNLVKNGLFPDLGAGSIAVSDAVPAVFYTAIFLGWSFACFWIRADVEARKERVRRSEAQAAATRAELQRLRLQLDPHFLFNALNTVAVEIPENPAAALEMTRRIAAYLRYSLDEQTRPICLLSEEMEAVRAYVRIQELRFEGRLRCTVEMDAATGTVAVPHLAVQGLVENAVKHGLRSSDAALDIRVTARRLADDAVVIEVTNPGQLTAHAGDRPALGLANTRRRLEMHYPSRHELSLIQDGNATVARIMLKGSACFA
jgi:two-component system LytT family sensor kinase